MLLVAAVLLVINLATLAVLYLMPTPDSSTLPGRLPEHDISLERQ